MNLSDFESHIDTKIIARGYDYYENGNVTSLEETEENFYEAEVEGTELYTVEVELDDKADIIYTQCDCPYEMGAYCKHQAAVFFVLRKMKHSPGGNSYPAPHSTESATVVKLPATKKTKTFDIEKILSERTKEELVKFLLNIASEYKEIKQRIALDFSDGNDEDEIRKSIELIRTCIRNNSDRHGFVAYAHAYEAVKGADLVLAKARSALDRNKTMQALDLILCVIHEMVDLIGSADDSDGVVGEVIEESFALISEIIDDEELSQSDKESIFNKLLAEASDKRYEGWTDWRLDLLGSCSELSDTAVLRSKLENHLAAMIKNEKGDSWSHIYLAERVNLIRYHMIEQYDGPKKAQEFINQNLHYSDFRKMAIESAMRKKDYDSVINLTLAGEEHDEDKRGLVNQWKQYRYKAFQLSGRLDEQRAIAMEFILDGSFEYYQELKSTYDANEWRSLYPRIIVLLENQKRTYHDVYTRILIEEGEKQKLLEHVKGRPSVVEIYYRHLIPEFAEEVYTLFLQYIEQTAARANKRRDYQGVCAIIRNLKKAGGAQQASQIKQKLYDKYAKKPAFRDELSKV